MEGFINIPKILESLCTTPDSPKPSAQIYKLIIAQLNGTQNKGEQKWLPKKWALQEHQGKENISVAKCTKPIPQ